MGCTSSKQGDVVDTPPVAKNKEVAAPAADIPQPGPSVTQPAAATEAPAKPTSRPSLTSNPPPEGKQLREAEDKPKIIFVIGGPGSGKGTQCAKIVEKYGGGIRHISSGDLLRAEVEKGSDLGKELESIMKSGKLVSDDKIIQLLEKEIADSAWFGLAFLVDGFPRAVPQAEKFEATIRPADLVLYFECPESVMKERITQRGKTSGRKDDNDETVKHRLNTFNQQSLPVVKHYADQGKLETVSAVATPDEVFVEVAKALDNFFDGSNSRPKTKTEEVNQWRTQQVLDMEKRFYGGFNDAPAEPLEFEEQEAEILAPSQVKVTHDE